MGGHIDKIRGYRTPLKWHIKNAALGMMWISNGLPESLSRIMGAY